MVIYETIFILDSLMPPKDIDAAIEKISGIITKDNGKIRKVDKWGKKRLAYEIQKKQYGFYVAIEFEGKGDIPKKLENDYNYNDKVLRYLTYRYDKHKIKLMEAEEKREEKTTGMENQSERENTVKQDEVKEQIEQAPAAEQTEESPAETEAELGVDEIESIEEKKE